jgi:predicted nucleic acid-binding protein
VAATVSGYALDSSLAIALLVQDHPGHARAMAWWRERGQGASLCGHAAVETYSVLTRLPEPLRVESAEVAQRLAQNFGIALTLAVRTQAQLPTLLARAGVSGSAAYDALVGLAAKEHRVVLATRDARARATYEAVGATVEMVR